MTNNSIFQDLFVLELANNHLGSVERGLRIIADHAQVVRFNNVRAAIKLQFRDVERFIHKDFRDRQDIRYVKKTLDTQMSVADLDVLVRAIRKAGCITCATPFDEVSVGLCEKLDVQIAKLASSDINDWFLIERIAAARRPVIASTGGSSLKDVDDLVTFFGHRDIPLALNHCVSLYPTGDWELDLNQIDFLRNRYPNHVIGLSTHEHASWDASMYLSYAKGARMWERHVDVDLEGAPVSPYCSLPEQIDAWFRAHAKAREMCGNSGLVKRRPGRAETAYLDSLVRGVYATRDLLAGHILAEEDVYLAIPLQKGQISCREFISGEILREPVAKDAPVRIDMIDSPYAHSKGLQLMISSRGI